MKTESAKKIFQRIANSLGLCGRDTTFFMKLNDSYLLFNYQKASNNQSFYINCGVSYISLLSDSELKHSPESAYSHQADQFPIHVDFRAENVPNASVSQADIDAAVSKHDTEALEKIISAALEKTINFTCNHGSREEVRKLKQAKIFPAIVDKKV